jgi:hypothetical protein
MSEISGKWVVYLYCWIIILDRKIEATDFTDNE